jgi:hypothetical protein
MDYSFDIKIAEKYGVDRAIMLHNLVYWVKHNAANKKNFYDGKFWTYNSVKAFEKIFPFWSYKTIRRIIESLLKDGLIIVGNFNESTYDRTSWYTLSDEIIEAYKLVEFLGKCICPNGQMEMPKQADGNAQTGESYIGNINKHISKPDGEGIALSFLQNNFPMRYENIMMQYKSQINDYFKFAQLFEATVLKEKLEFDGDVLEGRFRQYAINFIYKQEKYDNAGVIPLNPNQKKEKIGGF